MPGAFVDTNIIVYAADQVLNEFTVNARSPNKLNLSARRELEWIERLALLPIEPMNEQSFLTRFAIPRTFVAGPLQTINSIFGLETAIIERMSEGWKPEKPTSAQI